MRTMATHMLRQIFPMEFIITIFLPLHLTLTEMDFMARLALLRNSFFSIALVLQACSDTVTPEVWVDESKEKIETKKGITYYKAKPFSGWAYSLYANGDTTSVTPYYNGKINGLAKAWYANRNMK